MPHYRAPAAKHAHVIIVYRNVQKMGPYSHRALGVGALHTCRVLRRQGIAADPLGVWPPEALFGDMARFPDATHVVIEAPWIATATMLNLMATFPNVQWLVRAHSQIGFLQVEPGAIAIMRDLMLVQDDSLNLTVAANNAKLAEIFENIYQGRVLHLPNLYDLERPVQKLAEGHHHRKLVIGSFGALRLLKNHITGAAASLIIAKRRRSDLEFWINVGREESAGCRDVLPALRNMFRGLPWAKLVEHPWESWAAFRRTVSYMDLLMQPSFTETFNITAADAVSEGVPVVGSEAIEWLPEPWQARPDDADNVARIGMWLLGDPGAPADGLAALEQNQTDAIGTWLAYLDSNPT